MVTFLRVFIHTCQEKCDVRREMAAAAAAFALTESKTLLRSSTRPLHAHAHAHVDVRAQTMFVSGKDTIILLAADTHHFSPTIPASCNVQKRCFF